MMRRPRWYPMLAAPEVGIVAGSLCVNRTDAALLLADRVANGDAFAGERVVRVPRRILWRERGQLDE